MINWKEKLNMFLNDYEHSEDKIGILVCGSYITGNPTSHSDLDVHIILDGSVQYRERGNKIIDGLLIEYFANPPIQIRKYFAEDYGKINLMSCTQFATGLILEDKNGEVLKLKEEAIGLIKLNFKNTEIAGFSDADKYVFWDMLDDLEDALEEQRIDFDFLYYNNLNALLEKHMLLLKHPYDKKVVVGNITSEAVRKKYLLNTIKDEKLAELILIAITEKSKCQRLAAYKKLTQILFDKTGGFDIDGFKFQSDLEI